MLETTDDYDDDGDGGDYDDYARSASIEDSVARVIHRTTILHTLPPQALPIQVLSGCHTCQFVFRVGLLLGRSENIR